MKYSHLLNERSIPRCIKELLKRLTQAGVLEQYQQAVREAIEKPGSYTFPGFNMLTPAAPYHLFVPAPTCDAQDFLGVYEEFSDRPLGFETRPGVVAARVYRNYSEGARMMKHLMEHDQWRSPALLLLAAARHLGAETETMTDSTARMRLGTGILQVTVDGCYSNFRRAVFPCHKTSPAVPATVIRQAATRHPSLTALTAVAEEMSHSTMYIGTALALALQAGEVSDEDLLKALQGCPSPSVRITNPGPKGREAAEQILMTQSVGLVHALYGSLVPSSMSSREFRRKFGSPHKISPYAKSRPATRERWLELIS